MQRHHLIPPSVVALVAGTLASLLMPQAQAAVRKAVVVELFTSQGCSSCPPADKLLALLARDPSVVALSRPVTYWDRLGWKDTLARPENTQLQYDYAQRLGASGVYTPQAVINGRNDVVGSRAAALRTAVNQALPASISLDIEANPSGGWLVRPVTMLPADTRWRLVRVTPDVPVPIRAGENDGAIIHYTNVVRTDQRIAPQRKGDAFLVSAPGAEGRFALLLDRGPATPIMAAAWLN